MTAGVEASMMRASMAAVVVLVEGWCRRRWWRHDRRFIQRVF
jgi:hypothetical protein